MYKTKHILRFFFLLIFILSLISSCKKIEEVEIKPEEKPVVNWPISINNTEITEKPINVLSLSPALTEMSFEMGFKEKIAGRSDYCTYPTEVKELISAGSVNVIDFDAINTIKPDYIILQSPLSSKDQELLNFQGIKIVEFEKAATINELLDLYKKIFLFYEGIEDGEKNGKNYTDGVLTQLEELKMSIPEDRLNKTTAVYLNGIENMAATPDTFEGNILSYLSLVNVATKDNWEMDFNLLNENPPDIFFLGTDDEISSFLQEDIYKNSEIIKINVEAMERQSPRLILELKSYVTIIFSKLE